MALNRYEDILPNYTVDSLQAIQELEQPQNGKTVRPSNM